MSDVVSSVLTLNLNPKSFLFAIVGAEYVLKLLPRGTHAYENFIKLSELVAAARQGRLDVVSMKGMGYNPITDHSKLSNDTTDNYLVAKRRRYGSTLLCKNSFCSILTPPLPTRRPTWHPPPIKTTSLNTHPPSHTPTSP